MLISLPTPKDLLQVAAWHDNQARLKSKRKGKKLDRDIARHKRIAEELRDKAGV
jgi:hypothetical protein